MQVKGKPQKYDDFQQKFVYTKLDSVSLGSTEPYHIYGVVFDASIPYVKQKPTCQIRIIDQTLNKQAAAVLDRNRKDNTALTKPNSKAQTFVPVQFFSNDTGMLPHVVHIGDIVRVNRVVVSQFQGVTQLNSNIYNRSNWVVFKGARALTKSRQEAFRSSDIMDLEERENQELQEDPYQPIACSLSRFSFHPSEMHIIDKLRAWSKDYFQKFLVFDHELSVPPSLLVPLPQPPMTMGFEDEENKLQAAITSTVVSQAKRRDFDLFGQITKVKQLDDVFSQIWFRDWQGVLYEMRVNTQKFPVISLNAVIRLRSVTVSSKSASGLDAITLEDGMFTNILLFQSYSKQAKVISERWIDEDLLKSLISQTTATTTILSKPKIVSQLQSELMLSQAKQKQQANLVDLFGQKTQSANYMPSETQFRIKAFLMGFQPQNVAEFCVAYCTSCNDTVSYTQMNNQTQCSQCQTTERQPVFQVVLYLKDESSLQCDEVYKVHYYSQVCYSETEGTTTIEDTKLFRFPPCNLYQDDQKRQAIKDYLHLLSQFNVYMEMGIEGAYCKELRQNIFSLVDGQLIDLPQQ